MVKIPLQVKLKRELHRKIAYAQDLIVKEVYSVFDKAVLHGGTAIWRCYNGRRFSEDLDFYLPKDKKKISDNSIYSELELDGLLTRLEATFQNIPGIICDYEMSDGNNISVYSLDPKSFVAEKSITYLKRFKVRDLWDVFFLLKIIDNAKEVKEVGNLIKNYKKPLDEEDLKVTILEGIIPSANEMINYIQQKWENKYI